MRLENFLVLVVVVVVGSAFTFAFNDVDSHLREEKKVETIRATQKKTTTEERKRVHKKKDNECSNILNYSNVAILLPF